MADFCTNCARDMGFTENGKQPDIDIQLIADGLTPGFYTAVLCEGCAMIGIYKNLEGGIEIMEDDGSHAPWDPEEDRMETYNIRHQ